MNLRLLLLLAALLLAASAPIAAPHACADIGRVKNVAGEVTIVRSNSRQYARVGDAIEESDLILTGPASSLGIKFADETLFSIGPESRLSLKQFRYVPASTASSFVAELAKGSLAVISGEIAKQSTDAMKIATPAATLGVRGTAFTVKVEE